MIGPPFYEGAEDADDGADCARDDAKGEAEAKGAVAAVCEQSASEAGKGCGGATRGRGDQLLRSYARFDVGLIGIAGREAEGIDDDLPNVSLLSSSGRI